MKAAIIGTGSIASTHAKILREMDIEISGILHPDIEKASAFTDRYGGKAVSKLEDLLESDADCVHLCTPPGTHFSYARALLLSRKNLLCEKPLCLTAEEADELVRLSEGLVAAVNFNVRYHSACRKAAGLVRDGALGRVLLIHGSYLQKFHLLPAPLDWRYDQNAGGPMRAVTEIGSHFIDLVRFLSGLEIEAVCADFGRFWPTRQFLNGWMYPQDGGRGGISVSSEDAATLLFRLSNGALGAAVFSEVSAGRINRLSVEVTGEKGNLIWNSEESSVLKTAHGEGFTEELFPFSGGFEDTFRELFKAVYRDIEAGAPSPRPDYPRLSDGQACARVCEAIYQSSERGGVWISVK